MRGTLVALRAWVTGKSFWIFTGALACATAQGLVACVEGTPPRGGWNPNEQRAGDKPGGVVVAHGEIAVAPRGDYLLFAANGGLVSAQTDGGAPESLPVQSPSRLAFNKDGSVVYVASSFGMLSAVDVGTKKVRWSRPIVTGQAERLRLGVSRADGRVFAIAASTIHIFDEETGAEHQITPLAREVVDLDVLADGRAVIVQRHEFVGAAAHTTIRIIYPNSTLSADLHVPNCADQLAITNDESRALLAPTTCQRGGVRVDPISVIDLTPGKEHFVRNLPGFGPVAVARSAPRAIGFVDAQQADPALFDDPAQRPSPEGTRYHLMILDPVSLRFRLHPYGERIPRYTVTPDGATLLVDSVDAGWTFGDTPLPRYTDPARIFDIANARFLELDGPSVALESFVLMGDSRQAFALFDGFLRVDIAARRIEELSVGFAPKFINLSPDERTIYLRAEGRICGYSVEEKRCTQSITTLSP